MSEGDKKMDNMASWIGVGAKGGGILGALGVETIDGKVCNVGLPQYCQGVNVTSLRGGLGLGGSVGLVIIMIFNCRNLWDLQNTTVYDWGVNIALGTKWDSVVKALKNGKMATATLTEIIAIRREMADLYRIYGMAKMKGPKLVSFPIPFASIGAEISAFRLKGTITIGEPVNAAATKKQPPEPVGGLPGRKY